MKILQNNSAALGFIIIEFDLMTQFDFSNQDFLDTVY